MVTLQIPFTMTIAGSTFSGKTCFVRELIKNRHVLFDEQVTKVYYHYSVWQPIFTKMEKDGVVFVEGLPNMDELQPNSWLVLDDLFSQLAKSPNMETLFCVRSHHNSISVIFIT